MVLLAGVGGYVAFFRPAPASKLAATPPVTHSLAGDNQLSCARDMAVSPDGASVAVLGYRRTCPLPDPQGYSYAPGQVNVYSTKNGQLVAQVQPDSLIAPVFHPRVPPGAQPGRVAGADASHPILEYQQIIWSADGTRLAIPFSFPTYAGASPQVAAYTEGVLLTDAAGAHPRVLAHSRNPYAVSTGAWNLTRGAYIPVPKGIDPATWRLAPPTLSYLWDASNTLVPQGPALSLASLPAAPALGPIGNSIGGRDFTIWQPAQVEYLMDTASGAQPAPVPGLFSFLDDFAVWSPDGSRLFPHMNASGVLVADGREAPSPETLAPLRLASTTALIPMRDKGLAAALAEMQPVDAFGNRSALSAVWRPDGRVLAVPVRTPAVPGAVNKTPAEVRLYDCATGKRLATLPEPVEANGRPQGNLYLRWTPDGTQLVLLDAGLNRLISWGPKQLPSW